MNNAYNVQKSAVYNAIMTTSARETTKTQALARKELTAMKKSVVVAANSYTVDFAAHKIIATGVVCQYCPVKNALRHNSICTGYFC